MSRNIDLQEADMVNSSADKEIVPANKESLYQHQSALTGASTYQHYEDQKISFLSLPAEIQNMIFACLFEDTKHTYASLSRGKDEYCYDASFTADLDQGAHGRCLWDVISLSQTCTAIRQTVLPMFLMGSRIHVNFDRLKHKKHFKPPMTWTGSARDGRLLEEFTHIDLLRRTKHALQPELLKCLTEAGETFTAHIGDLSFNLFQDSSTYFWRWNRVMWTVKVNHKREVRAFGHFTRLDNFFYISSRGDHRVFMCELETMLTKMLAESRTGGIGLKELEAIRKLAAEFYSNRVVESL